VSCCERGIGTSTSLEDREFLKLPRLVRAGSSRVKEVASEKRDNE
jgi:hypothetical protein